MTTVWPAPSPESNLLHQTPASSPSISWIPNSLTKPPIRFTPPLIGMVVIIATAFIIITYSRSISQGFLRLRCRWLQWRRRRRSYVPSSIGNDDIESPAYSGEESYDPNHGYQLFSQYGLDDALIKTIPLSVHVRKSSVHECAVCLLEFKETDYVRTLPVCFHSFHVDCIDIWLRCHANCPLCRSSILRPESMFIPVMSPRIRPDFEDVIVHSTIIQPSPEAEHSRQGDSNTAIGEISPDVSPSQVSNHFDDRFNRRNFLFKRSYSFGFERNLGSDRLVPEPAMSSPRRYRRGIFWCKKPSPVNLTKTSVFSFRYYRGIKSPFFRRLSGSILTLPESSIRYSDGDDGSSSSRRRKSLAGPIFVRHSRVNSCVFSSSRLRSGDPEALLSPERYNRR